MSSVSGQGGGGPKSRRVPLPRYSLVDLVDEAQAFYRHCRIGREATPVFDEDYEGLEAFGVPVEMKSVGGFDHHVPVLPWGWWVPIVDA